MRTFTEEEVEEMMDSGVCEKPKTNADSIRSFSDEELADLLTIQRTCHCADGRCLGAKYCYYHTPGGDGCREAILRHLQEEAEEEV